VFGHRWAAVPLAVCCALLASSCTTARTATGLTGGRSLEVLGAWTGAEAQNFDRVLAGFEARTGVSVAYTPAGTAGVPSALNQRLAAGRAPDVAFLPQAGSLRQYAARGVLVPLDPATVSAVNTNYNATWRGLGSVGGRMYGVWFKAADKSLVWYNIGAFERVGVVPPDDIGGLLSVARTLTASGLPAFAVGGADRWTLNDWFGNLYLRLAGPAAYDRLADHRIPWTDPSVTATLRLMSEVLDPGLLVGGTAGALDTTFTQSVDQVFGQPPAAAITSEGDFVAGVVSADTPSVLGIDADQFPFPAVGASAPGVIGGGDVAVLLRRSSAGSALLRYLTSPAAAARWAVRGGFISPNINLNPAIYPDAITRSEARSVLDAGSSFHFGLADLQPPSFGATPSAGLEKELADFLVNRDVDGTASRLEAAAGAAYGR
jgi:ABC-type glycerol-3-phosphate transport system substrate-binding protein